MAKREGKVVKGLIKQGFTEGVGYVVNYQGIQIPYRSEAHYDLIVRAIRAKFEQNPDCLKALLRTGKKLLTHDFGYTESPTTYLPAEVFTTILMTIREEYQLSNTTPGVV